MKRLAAVLNPFRWFASEPHEVRLVYFNKLIYAYPLVLAGWLFSPLVGWGVDPETLAWAWITIATFVLATISIDLPRNATIFTSVCIGFIWLFGNRMSEWGVPVWSYVHNHFAELDVRYDSGTFRALSVLISVAFFANLLYCLFEHRVRINHNEVVRHAFLRRVDSLPRMGCVFRLHMPDSLEFIAGFGAGTLEVSRGRKRMVLTDVPLLFPRFKKIDKILDSWGVTELAADDTADDDDDAVDMDR